MRQTIDTYVENENYKLKLEKFVKVQISNSLKDHKIEKREGSWEWR